MIACHQSSFKKFYRLYDSEWSAIWSGRLIGEAVERRCWPMVVRFFSGEELRACPDASGQAR